MRPWIWLFEREGVCVCVSLCACIHVSERGGRVCVCVST